MLKTPKIIFWGTPEFALPALEFLLKNDYEIAGVVTALDEPKGRKFILTPPPVKILAQRYSLPIFQPDNLEIGSWKLEIPKVDLHIVVAYGKIIPSSILQQSRLGALNIHPSLLPRWRGPSPIQSTILNGDQETGVTIIKLDEQMDHGPILATSDKRQVTSQTTYQKLHDELSRLGAELLVETLPGYLAGKIKPKPQDDSAAIYCPVIAKKDGRINWGKPAEEIERLLRAFNPWPSAWTFWSHGGKNKRLRIDEVDILPDSLPGKAFGYVWQKDSGFILVQTGKGSLLIKKLTLEGRKTVSASDFLKGYPRIIGSILL